MKISQGEKIKKNNKNVETTKMLKQQKVSIHIFTNIIPLQCTITLT